MAKRVLARGERSAHAGVLFMFRPDDFRLTDERFKDDYTVLAHGESRNRDKVLVTDDGREFTVHGDWSVTEGQVRRYTMADHRRLEGNEQ